LRNEKLTLLRAIGLSIACLVLAPAPPLRAQDDGGEKASPAMSADPWLALDALHAKGLFERGEAFVAALPPAQATKSLAAYARRMRAPQTAARKRLVVLEAQIGPEQPADLPTRIAAVKVVAHSVPVVEAAVLRARALDAAGDVDAAATAFDVAGRMATSLGWDVRAVDAFMDCFLRLAGRSGRESEAQAALQALKGSASRTPMASDDAVAELYEGGLLAQAGQPRSAIPVLRRAAATLEKTGPPGDLAQAHATLSQALVMAGQYGLALHHSELAQALYEKLGFLPGVLYSRSGQIATFSGLGLDEETVRLCKIQMREAQAGALQSRPLTLTAMAIAEARLGRAEMSARHFTRALEALRASGEAEELGICLLNRGRELHLLHERYAAARRDFEEARGLEGTSARLHAYAVLSIAEVRGRTNHWSEADDLLAQAATEARESGDRALASATESLLAERDLAAGSARTAYVHARTAALVVLDEVGRLGHAEGIGLLGLRESRRTSAILLGAALALGDAKAIHEAIEMSRAEALLSNVGGWQHLRDAAVPTDLQRAMEEANADVTAAQEASAKIRSRPGAKPDRIRALKARVAEAEKTLAPAQARLQREAKRLAKAVRPDPVELKTLRAWLRPEEGFVHFVVASGQVHALFVQRRGATLHGVMSEEALAPHLRAMDDLRDTGEAIARDKNGLPKTITALARALFASLEIPKTVRTLVVAPAPQLANLPWPLLGRSFGGRALVVTPSASMLLAQDHAPITPEAPRFLVGLSNYGRIPGQGGARRLHAPGGAALADLPEAAAEARELIRDKKDIPFHKKDIPFIEEKATESAVAAGLRADGTRSILHFACHGLLHPRRPSLSSLALRPGGGEDGFLTVAEVLSLRLTSGLVVLSACDVGSMLTTPGEGYVGLPPAILAAGGRRVLCNLWRVADEAARVFMRMFYTELGKSNSALDALRKTQERFRMVHPQWKHPYYWAGWTMWGTPR